MPENGEELYRFFMEEVEPDLLSENIEHLDEMYPGETPEEHLNRYRGYSQAFYLFDEFLKNIDATAEAEFKRIAKAMDLAAELEEKGKVQETLDGIEQQIAAFA